MPRSLTLVRHAKSSWADAGLTDFERPLNRRGLSNAPMMGQRLARAGYRADAIISSPAVRAATTADLIAEEIGFHRSRILRKHSVYASGLATLLEVLTQIDNAHQHAMLVGHNPGVTQLCNHLCAGDLDNMPTCSIACIEFDAQSWEDAVREKGHLAAFDYPKNT